MAMTSPSNTGGVGSKTGQEAEIPHALWLKKKKKKERKNQKQYCNKFNKHVKKGPHQKNLKKKKVVGVICIDKLSFH